jgi:membrane-bound inhibitor of C-type lysozyme
MSWGRVIVAVVAGTVWNTLPAAAGSLLVYQCADGAQFALAFYDGDTHAHIQLNGKSLSLPKRLALSGTRYAAAGVTLWIAKDGTTLKHPAAPAVTICKPLDKW